jgi:hypothetical protein
MITVQSRVSFSFLLISKFCCNLTKNLPKLVEFMPGKKESPKKLPISLLKNVEISPGKKHWDSRQKVENLKKPPIILWRPTENHI